MNASLKRVGDRLLKLLQALAFCVLIQAGMAQAQNLAANPGFETGNTSGWIAFGSPTISAETNEVHSGVYAALVTNRTATYMGIAQQFQGVLQPSQTYNISVWVRLAGGTSQTLQLTMQQEDGSGTNYSTIASATVSTSGWTQLPGQFVLNVSGTLTSLVLYAQVTSSATAAYYIDDLSVASTIIAGSNGQCTVDWNNVFQRIDGFGASSAWRGNWTAAQADMFFSTNSGTGTTLDGKTNFSFNGIGLSLLRNHIVYASSTASNAVPSSGEISIMQMAQTRGARVWSAPWTPAFGFKSNKTTNGGSYLGSGNNATNTAYAAQLANYVASMKSPYGVNIYALSVQNEPDYPATNYESCSWTGQQIHDFVTNLYAALSAAGVGSTRIIIPESQSWSGDTALYTPALNDPTSAADASIIADHDYVADNVVGDTNTPAALAVSGQATWETEVSQIGGGYDGSITNALYWSQRLHLYMTAAQVNAWHYWWLISANADNEGLTDTNGMPAARMYILGQFARFIRPNFYRVNAATNSGTTLVSAYKDSASTAYAIVAINPASNAVSETFDLTNFAAAGSLTPWVTSATMSLAIQPAIAASNFFGYTLPAMSVVTFTGNADLPPTNIYLSNNSISEGLPSGTVVGNFSTADPTWGDTFTYTLVTGSGDNDNASFSITNQTLYTAAVFDFQVQNTFNIRVRSTDQNGLWCEQTFVVSALFNTQARQIVSAATGAGGYLALTFAGIPGSTCQIQTATNLTPPVNWALLTNSANGSTNFVLAPDGLWTNIDLSSTNFPTRFYRTVEP